jgi:hypothetical protein
MHHELPPEVRGDAPPVGRIGRAPLSDYEGRARALVAAVRAGEDDALRRVRHHVPRLATFTGPDLAESDARIVVAREYGFPSWDDLMQYAQKAIDEYEHRPSGTLADAFELIRQGDVEGLRKMLDADPSLVHATYRGAATTMLEAVAQPDVFGENLGLALGVDRRIVALLIERGSALDTALNLAACFNRAELVEMLLGAGASTGPDKTWSLTPLQAALYHGQQEAGDLLGRGALEPDAPYTAAGAGRLDVLETWLSLSPPVPLPDAPRPNLADVGWPPGPPPIASAQDVLDEAFAMAAFNGRIIALDRLLAHGASVDGTLHLGLTGLHLAVIRRRVDVARWLVAHGARLDLHDKIHDGTPVGWARHNANGSPIHVYLESLET